MNLINKMKTIFARQGGPATPTRYPAATMRNISTFVTEGGSYQLDYELIDALYEKTIMNTIINKIVGDASRLNYDITISNIDGTENHDLTMEIKKIDHLINRRTLRSLFKDMLKYGIAFLYIEYEGDEPRDAFPIHPSYVTPNIKDGEIQDYTYMGLNGRIKLQKHQLIPIPRDQKTGELYGTSIFAPIMTILELILNTQLNLAIIVDRYALPIIQWALDTGFPDLTVEEEDLINFLKTLEQQFREGNDIATDSKVEARVIGTDDNMADFVPILRGQLEIFGITVGVPLQLLGMKGDNLSVTTRQMQAYLSTIRDLQEALGDMLVEELFKPYLEAKGYTQGEDYHRIYISFPILAVEENSKAITWLIPAIDKGLITRTEARNTLGFHGEAIPVEDIELFPSPEVVRPGRRKDPSEVKEPKVGDEE
ncbi:MAG TPA: phage portal protein [Candidatus Hydrothermia bacterium]|nr:phage portal protein [Candidatus Hydrothermia bacterium]